MKLTGAQLTAAARRVGIVLLGVVAAAAFGAIGWWAWPSGIFDVPLRELTLHRLAACSGSVVSWIVAVGCLGTATDRS